MQPVTYLRLPILLEVRREAIAAQGRASPFRRRAQFLINKCQSLGVRDLPELVRINGGRLVGHSARRVAARREAPLHVT